MPKTVKGGPLRFFIIHSVAKFQKTEETVWSLPKNIREKQQKK